MMFTTGHKARSLCPVFISWELQMSASIISNFWEQRINIMLKITPESCLSDSVLSKVCLIIK